MRASDRAYRTLRQEIVDGILAPGTVLGEVEQAARLGVSRTPVREALSRLVADGLVAVPSGRALVVTEVSLDDIVDLYELRQALEQQAAGLAAQRRDPAAFEALRARLSAAPELIEHGESGLSEYYAIAEEFDETIDSAIANPYLEAALHSVRLHSARIRHLARNNPDRLRAAAAEHLLIIDAILAGDVALAANATHVHLHNSLDSILRSEEAYSIDANRVA